MNAGCFTENFGIAIRKTENKLNLIENKHWNRLPREMLAFLYVQILSAELDRALGNTN